MNIMHPNMSKCAFGNKLVPSLLYSPGPSLNIIQIFRPMDLPPLEMITACGYRACYPPLRRLLKSHFKHQLLLFLPGDSEAAA